MLINRIHLSLPPSAGMTSVCHNTYLFIYFCTGSAVPAKPLMFARQALYPLSHLQSPHSTTENTRMLSWQAKYVKMHWNLQAFSGPQTSQLSAAWYFAFALAHILEIFLWLAPGAPNKWISMAHKCLYSAGDRQPCS